MSQENRLSLSSYIQNAMQTVRRGGKPLVQTLLCGQAGIILVSLLCGQANPFNNDPAQNPLLYMVWTVITGVISILMMLSALFILKNARQDNIITWKEALHLAAGRFWKVLGASIWYLFLMWLVFLVFALVVIALVVSIYTISPSANILVGILAGIAAVWLFITTLLGAMFSIYAVAVDDTPVFQALPKVYEYLKQDYWHTLKLSIVAGLIILVFSTLIGLIQMFIIPLYVVNTFLGIAGTWLLSLPCTVINSVVGLGLAYELYAVVKRTEQPQQPN